VLRDLVRATRQACVSRLPGEDPRPPLPPEVGPSGRVHTSRRRRARSRARRELPQQALPQSFRSVLPAAIPSAIRGSRWSHWATPQPWTRAPAATPPPQVTRAWRNGLSPSAIRPPTNNTTSDHVEDSIEQRGDTEGYRQKQQHPPDEDGDAKRDDRHPRRGDGESHRVQRRNIDAGGQEDD
jgi:hypothetical protein